MPKPEALGPQSLYSRCDPASLPFETTAELEELPQLVGQERALDALHFGTRIRNDGYNLFVLGPHGIGKQTTVQRFLTERASQEATPSDWCYVYNFEEPHRPSLLSLSSGYGGKLRQDLEQLIDELRSAIPAIFEGDEYQNRVRELQQEFQQRQQEAFQEIQQDAEQHDIAVIQTPSGLTFAPIKEGEVLSPDEFYKLPEEKRREIEETISQLQERVQKTLQQFPKWRKETQEKIKELNREMGLLAVGNLIESFKKDYSDFPQVVAHFDAIQEDVIDNIEAFRGQQEGQQRGAQPGAPPPYEAVLNRYRANLLVDNSDLEGAPVVHEDLPSHQHLVGRVEHWAQQGTLLTDFTLIKPGALHRANGGYLILDARQVLMQPFAWESLKRVLYAREIRIESIEQIYSLWSTVSLEPDPIPLNVKVILLGERFLYYLLFAYDPDFQELFKVQADFEEDIERSEETNLLYARLIGTIAQHEGLKPLNRAATARFIEHGSRLAEDSERLSTHARGLADLLREANFWAGEDGSTEVEAEHVQKAIDKQIYRSDRVRERVERAIQRGTVLIDTAGPAVGQINGLAYMQLGSFAFGRPSRITAAARLGDGKVIDIEREVELGGSLHSKGVMILSGFIGGRYATQRQLSFSASLTFEQSYGMIEGDSASAAELCTLLSVLAEVPLSQALAITGSVNQHGQIQAIGGVNEKIEGFFDICKARGWAEGQGVIIPASNVPHLMLRADVREASANGQFQVFPVQRIDQALELLTGLEAGERGKDGLFPEGSLNRRVEDRLEELSKLSRKHDHSEEEDS